jgi:hypothetical protein
MAVKLPRACPVVESRDRDGLEANGAAGSNTSNDVSTTVNCVSRRADLAVKIVKTTMRTATAITRRRGAASDRA